MKKFVFLLTDNDGNVRFVYDHKDLAEKLLAPLSLKIGKPLTISKMQMNPDLASVKEEEK